MSDPKQKKKLTRKQMLVRKYFITLFAAFGIFLVGSSAVIFAYGLVVHSREAQIREGLWTGTSAEPSSTDNPGQTSAPQADKSRTTFLILATDADKTRSDVMIAGCFNSETGKIDLVSIPRDTYTTLSQDKIDMLKEHKRPVPSGGVCKINEVTAYGGSKDNFGSLLAQKCVEELLGIKIDYYVRFDLKGFQNIVEKMGGVEFNVPQRMYYNDDAQNLHIDLYPGLQKLNGKQAEQLVRYRKKDEQNPISPGYPRGDLDRIDVQHEFLRAFISQACSRENLFTNAAALIDTLISYVQTDVTPVDALKYVKYVNSITADSINTYMMPGEDKTYNGVSYVFKNDAEIKAMVDPIFYNSNVVSESSVGKTIQVLNGSGKSGMASVFKDKLIAEGFDVTATGEYKGINKTDYTRIIVKRRGHGEDIAAKIPGSQIVINPDFNKYDVVVLIGRDDAQ